MHSRFCGFVMRGRLWRCDRKECVQHWPTVVPSGFLRLFTATIRDISSTGTRLLCHRQRFASVLESASLLPPLAPLRGKPLSDATSRASSPQGEPWNGRTFGSAVEACRSPLSQGDGAVGHTKKEHPGWGALPMALTILSDYSFYYIICISRLRGRGGRRIYFGYRPCRRGGNGTRCPGRGPSARVRRWWGRSGSPTGGGGPRGPGW